MRRKSLAIVKDLKAHGVNAIIYETYRSTERQLELYLQHASELKHVGVHHYGLACDIVFLTNGEPDWGRNYGILGHVAKAHGLVWGGDWGHPDRPTSFPDLDHVQMIQVAQQDELFAGRWYPAVTG